MSAHDDRVAAWTQALASAMHDPETNLAVLADRYLIPVATMEQADLHRQIDEHYDQSHELDRHGRAVRNLTTQLRTLGVEPGMPTV